MIFGWKNSEKSLLKKKCYRIILSDLKEKFSASKQSSCPNELDWAHCFLKILLRNHVFEVFREKEKFRKKIEPKLELIIFDF